MSEPDGSARAQVVRQVAADAYDLAAFERVLDRHPDLGNAIETGMRLQPHFRAFAEDVFALLFKYAVERIAEAPVSARISAMLLDHVATANGFSRLKAETTLDEVRAGFATRRIVRGALALLRDPELFSSEELLESFEAASIEGELADRDAELDAIDDLQAVADAREAQSDDETAPNTAEPGEPGGEAPPDEPAAAAKGEPATDETSVSAVQGTLDSARAAATREADALKRALRALERAVERRIERLPVRAEVAMRRDVETLPDTMVRSQAEANVFADVVVGDGELDAHASLELGERLVDNEKLKRLARLVGAFRHLARGVTHRRLERRSNEVHEVERAGELARVLPSELVLLRHPLLRRDFMRRLVERDLAAYAVHGKDRAGQGPMIVCIDGSGSMRGAREIWAKAVALTLLERARRRRRAFHAIVFSGSSAMTRDFQLTDESNARSVGAPPVDYRALVAFADYFPRGGTRFEDPLDRAVTILREETRFRRGDIVLVTDGEATVPPQWRARFDDARGELGFQLHAVLVDIDGGRRGTLANLADHVHTVTELTGDEARSLFAAIG